VRSSAQTHKQMTPEKRLELALNVCEQLLNQTPVKDFVIELPSGNWDDSSIEKICERLGCDLMLTSDVKQAAKRPVLDDVGAFKLVRQRRNQLAHGTLSFAECSDDVAVADLKSLTTAVGDYLREAVHSFVHFIGAEIGKTGDQVAGEGVLA
jgi:hypothetical protein